MYPLDQAPRSRSKTCAPVQGLAGPGRFGQDTSWPPGQNVPDLTGQARRPGLTLQQRVSWGQFCTKLCLVYTTVCSRNTGMGRQGRGGGGQPPPSGVRFWSKNGLFLARSWPLWPTECRSQVKMAKRIIFRGDSPGDYPFFLGEHFRPKNRQKWRFLGRIAALRAAI